LKKDFPGCKDLLLFYSSPLFLQRGIIRRRKRILIEESDVLLFQFQKGIKKMQEEEILSKAL